MRHTFQLGQGDGWPGLDEQKDARATRGATAARHTLRDSGRLECRPGEGAALVMPSSPLRAVFEHTKQSDGTKVLLAVAGRSLYRKGTGDTTPVTLAFSGGAIVDVPDGGVTFVQDGTRTLLLVSAGAVVPPLPAPYTPDPIPDDDTEPDRPAPDGVVTVIGSDATALVLNVSAGTDDSEAVPSRVLKVYTSEANRDANSTTGLVASYPRTLGPDGADLFSYRADGLNPTATYYGSVSYTDGSGNTRIVPFSGTTGAGTAQAVGSVPLIWDEDTPDVVYPLQLPAAPTITSIARADYVDSTFDRTMGNYLPLRTGGNLGTGWTVTGASLGNAEWTSTPMGGIGLHVDTSSVVGDGTEQVYFTETTPVDLSSVNGLTFKAFSGGNEKTTGQHWALILAEQSGGVPDTWFELPFSIPTAGQTCDVTVSLADIPASSRNAIVYWGFRWTNNVESVIWINRLRSYGGLEGQKEYALVLRKTLLSGEDGELLLDSPESAIVSADAGTNGAQLTVAFAAIPADHSGLIYRRDETAGRLHYVATVAAAATSYVDTVSDISTNPVLVEGRAGVPMDATAIGLHHGRLVLATAGSLWVSSLGNIAEWFDRDPAMLPDLHALGLVTDKDGMRLPLSDAGAVRAMLPLGVWTGADFVGDTLVMTDAWDVRLSGTTPDTFSLGYRRQGGVCGGAACCRDNAGRALKIDPEGQVWAVDTGWAATALSTTLHDTLRALANKGTWSLEYDVASECAVLVAGTRVFLFSALGIDEWTAGADGVPVALVARAGSDGGYVSCGTAGGRLYRLLDPLAAPERGAVYYGPEWSLAEDDSRPVSLTVRCEGSVSATVSVNGAAVRSGAVVSGKRWLFPPRAGETVRVALALAAGAKVHSAVLSVEGR